MEVPKVMREETVLEEHHGIKICDPYRWLENPDSEETKKFVDAQNEYSVAYLDQCSVREQLKEKLTKMWNYPRYSCPYKRGSKYFYYMNTGLQNQSVLYVQDSLEGEPHIFFDPNELSEDGTVAISTTAFSEDGEIFAYGLSDSGSDWITIHFKKVENGEDFSEALEKVKFSSISWTHDNKGIFYACYPDNKEGTTGAETNCSINQKLYYHMLGTPQSEDVLVVEFPEHPKWRIEAEVSDCGKYLVICSKQELTENLVHYCLLPEKISSDLPLTCIVDKFEECYEYVTNDGKMFIFRTNRDAPNYKLIKINFDDPHPSKWSTIIPEHKCNVLDWATCVDNDKLVICYMADVKNQLEIRSLSSGDLIYEIPLEMGSISGYSGKQNQNEMFYSYISFLSPGKIFHLDFSKQPFEPKVFREIHIDGFNPSDFEMHQKFYSGKDGTKIPMFIVHKKDLVKGNSIPLLLYGYGGFNISITPHFSVSRILFMQMMNGAVAIPNIRGGGEYGEKWHDAGRLLTRQNVFDDFQSAAEYLIEEKYTTKSHIIINGYSNGGLLVGACINQRPDLFGAAVAGVGVFDLLRFHKFTIGHAWCGDYGNPDEEKHFINNLKYSPLHNVSPPPEGVQYPAVLLLTADHDDRVVPLHSLKMIAELQYKISPLEWQKNPLIIRVETKAGHGGGKPTKQKIAEVVDTYSFIINALKLSVE